VFKSKSNYEFFLWTNLFKTNEILRKHNHNSLNSPKVTIHNTDAFIWLQQNKEKYDVVIIDFPDPSNYSLGKLYTTYFYKTLYESMQPNAVVTVQTTSPYYAPKSYWCVHETIGSVYPNINGYHTYVPSFGEWGFAIFSPNNLVRLNKVYRKLNNLKFYNYNLDEFSKFSEDMKAENVEINRLDNQSLVRYFDEEWSKI